MSTYAMNGPFAGRTDAPGRRRGPRALGRTAWVMADDRTDDLTDERSGGRSGGRGRRRGHSGGPSGFGPGFGPGVAGPGFGGPGGPGPFGHHGHRHRGGGRRGGRGGRGDVRAAVLLLLAEQPMHGYQLIQQVAERSGGVWNPSPGSVYPALSQLEDEGLVAFERVDGRKTASLTDAGREHVEAHRADLGQPWDDVSGGVSREARDLRDEIGALMGAAHQVSVVGTRGQVARAVDVLAQARRALYRVLADEPQDVQDDVKDDVQD